MIRFSRTSEDLDEAGTGAIVGALIGAAIGAAIARKGKGAAAGLVLGLLAGAVLSGGAANTPRRVFTLRFEPSTGEWRAYDGGLVPWMKEALLPE